MTIEVFSCRADSEQDVLLLAELLRFATPGGGHFRGERKYDFWLVEFWPHEHTTMNTMLSVAGMLPDPYAVQQTLCACPIDANPRTLSLE